MTPGGTGERRPRSRRGGGPQGRERGTGAQPGVSEPSVTRPSRPASPSRSGPHRPGPTFPVRGWSSPGASAGPSTVRSPGCPRRGRSGSGSAPRLCRRSSAGPGDEGCRPSRPGPVPTRSPGPAPLVDLRFSQCLSRLDLFTTPLSPRSRFSHPPRSV